MTYRNISIGWEIIAFVFLMLAGVQEQFYHHVDTAIYCLLWAIVSALFSISNKLEK